MILNQYLGESTIGYNGTVEPIFADHILGESAGEVMVITNEAEARFHELDENLLLAESLAFVATAQGNLDRAQTLQEGAISDFFAKVKQFIIELWGKIKGFFERLFKSIAINLRDINKALEGAEKFLKGKDFSKFSYQGYKWASNPGISAKLVKNLKEQGAIDLAAAKRSIAAAKKGGEADEYTKATKLSNNYDIGTLLGEQGAISIEQANDIIKKAYGCYGTATEITNFSAASYDNMLTFLRGYNKNKDLLDLQKETDTAYREVISNVDELKKESDSLVNDSKTDAKTKSASQAQSSIKNLVDYMKSSLTSYNKLMSSCISCNKKNFSEYKSVISSAIRYKAPEKK